MSEEKFVPYYSKIARVLDEMIPVEWTELFMIYFEEAGVLSTGTYFRSNDGILHWCHSIPSDFHVDEEIYDNIEEKLRDICEAYKKEFVKETGNSWSYMSFHLTVDMEFDVKYYYDTDSSVDIHDMMDRIFYDSYKIQPGEEYDKEELLEYIANKEADEK